MSGWFQGWSICFVLLGIWLFLSFSYRDIKQIVILDELELSHQIDVKLEAYRMSLSNEMFYKLWSSPSYRNTFMMMEEDEKNDLVMKIVYWFHWLTSIVWIRIFLSGPMYANVGFFQSHKIVQICDSLSPGVTLTTGQCFQLLSQRICQMLTVADVILIIVTGMFIYRQWKSTRDINIISQMFQSRLAQFSPKALMSAYYSHHQNQ